MFISFFAWWYGSGWQSTLKDLCSRTVRLSNTFSLSILLKTLISPWKRIITYPGAGLNAKFHALLDNLFSRLIGFAVRLFVIITSLILIFITLVASLLEVIIWPLLPISIIGFLITALTI